MPTCDLTEIFFANKTLYEAHLAWIRNRVIHGDVATKYKKTFDIGKDLCRTPRQVSEYLNSELDTINQYAHMCINISPALEEELKTSFNITKIEHEDIYAYRQLPGVKLFLKVFFSSNPTYSELQKQYNVSALAGLGLLNKKLVNAQCEQMVMLLSHQQWRAAGYLTSAHYMSDANSFDLAKPLLSQWNPEINWHTFLIPFEDKYPCPNSAYDLIMHVTSDENLGDVALVPLD